VPHTVAVHARAELVREGLAALLRAQPGIRVRGVAPEWQELVARADSVDVAVHVLEDDPSRWPGEIRSLRTARPGLRVVAVVSPRLVEDPRLSGSVVVSRADPPDQFIAAVTGRVPRRNGDHAPETAEGGPGLSPREAEIAELIASGEATADIAEVLGISPRTVENHTRSIYEKLGVQTRAQLASRLTRGSAADDQPNDEHRTR